MDNSATPSSGAPILTQPALPTTDPAIAATTDPAVQPTAAIPSELTPTPVEVAAAGVNAFRTEEGLFTTEVIGAIGLGTFDFEAPHTIPIDEPAPARLSMRLDREYVDPESVRIIITNTQTFQSSSIVTQQHFVSKKITLFQNMSAKLTGTPNLTIQPEIIIAKPIFAGNDSIWTWFITPSSETSSQQWIRLEIFANPNDSPFTLFNEVFPIQVEPVVIPTSIPVPTQSVSQRIVDNLVDNTTSVLIGIFGFMTLILLGGLISLIIFNNRKSETTAPYRLGTSRLRPLFRLINAAFNEPEIINICFGLGIRYTDLPGETQSNKIWQLLAYCQRNNRISELIALCKEARPQVNWGQAA